MKAVFLKTDDNLCNIYICGEQEALLRQAILAYENISDIIGEDDEETLANRRQFLAYMQVADYQAAVVLFNRHAYCVSVESVNIVKLDEARPLLLELDAINYAIPAQLLELGGRQEDEQPPPTDLFRPDDDETTDLT